MSARTRPTSGLPLPAICGLLLALLAVLWLAPGAPAKWRRWQAPAAQAPALDDVQQAQLRFNPAAGQTFTQVLARPLFMNTRRPGPATSAASAADAARAVQPIDQARVLGLLDGPSLSGALIEYDGQTQFVPVGQAIGGWRLTGLQDRTIHIERRGERRTLELPFLSGVDASATPGANTPPAPARPPVQRPAQALDQTLALPVPPEAPVSAASEAAVAAPASAAASAGAASAPAAAASAPASAPAGSATVGASFGGGKPVSKSR